MNKASIILIVIMLLSPWTASAQVYDHCGSDMNHEGSQGMQGMHHEMMNRPVQSIQVDGMKFTLDIMDMDMHMKMQKMKGNPVPQEFAKGADRAIMFNVIDESSRLVIDDANVDYIIISPTGEKEVGRAKWYGDHYGAPFRAKQKGGYKIQFTVASVDGKTRTGDFVYTLKS